MADEDSIAFTIKGVGVTAKQRDAGIAAMTDTFSKMDVQGAMVRAGVPHLLNGEHIADRAADRLLQSERRAGRVRTTSNRTWQRTPQ